MPHPIIVCLEHKLIFHSMRVAGRHAVSHYKTAHDCLEEGLFVEIDQCHIPRCGRDRLLPATVDELRRARRVLQKKVS